MSIASDNTGFIRENLDIKILILFVLEKLPRPIDEFALADLVLVDKGFTWFEYSDCLAALVAAGQVSQDEENKYEITEQGKLDVAHVGTSIPYSVRSKAERLAASAAEALRRSHMIETAVDENEDGLTAVKLRLSDGTGELISLRVAVPDEETAKKIEDNFRKHAENITNQILQLLV